MPDAIDWARSYFFLDEAATRIETELIECTRIATERPVRVCLILAFDGFDEGTHEVLTRTTAAPWRFTIRIGD
jgi:hypothetical protein